MEEKYKKILETAYPNKKTLANYESRIRALLKKVEPETLQTILENPDAHYPTIQKAYPSLTTRKNVLTVLLVFFREDKDLHENHKDAHAKWKKLHDDLVKLQDARIKRSEPEQKQVEKYTSFEEIEKKYKDLKKRTFHDTERHSMQYLLLSIIVHIRPKRADLGSIKIYREKDPRKTDENYIVLRKVGTSYLVMNMYKTSKYYQTVEEDIPEGLVRDIETSLARWPRDYLFRKDDGEPMSNNTYSVFVKTTFSDFFGRATGVSLLRHIYITEKLNFDDMTLEEQGEEAKLMLHTSGLQRQYKWPKKVLCPKLCAAYIKPAAISRKVRRISKRQTKKNVPTQEKEQKEESL
jgi:hypothetical protein